MLTSSQFKSMVHPSSAIKVHRHCVPPGYRLGYWGDRICNISPTDRRRSTLQLSHCAIAKIARHSENLIKYVKIGNRVIKSSSIYLILSQISASCLYKCIAYFVLPSQQLSSYRCKCLTKKSGDEKLEENQFQ